MIGHYSVKLAMSTSVDNQIFKCILHITATWFGYLNIDIIRPYTEL